jgi:hypothetical protein
VWRINAIADNCNLQHYKFLKVGDLIYTGAYCYKMRVGTIQFIRPQDIKAIYPVEA